MSTKEEIVQKLKALKPELQVDFTEDASLFDLVRLANFLSISKIF